MVVKPAIGASARQTIRRRAGPHAAERCRRPMRIVSTTRRRARTCSCSRSFRRRSRPTAGALGGRHRRRDRHAVVKRPTVGEWRVQSDFGGSAVRVPVTAEHERAVSSVLGAVDGAPTYARVDLVAIDGALHLMELELIEPELFLPRLPIVSPNSSPISCWWGRRLGTDPIGHPPRALRPHLAAPGRRRPPETLSRDRSTRRIRDHGQPVIGGASGFGSQLGSPDTYRGQCRRRHGLHAPQRSGIGGPRRVGFVRTPRTGRCRSGGGLSASGWAGGVGVAVGEGEGEFSVGSELDDPAVVVDLGVVV